MIDAAETAVMHRNEIVGTVLPAETGTALGQQTGNLDAARTLLARIEAGTGQSLREAVELAGETTQAQAKTLKIEPGPGTPAQETSTLSDALLVLAQHHDVSPDREQREQIAALETLPPQSRHALQRVVEAFLPYKETAVTFAGGGTQTTGTPITPGPKWQIVDPATGALPSDETGILAAHGRSPISLHFAARAHLLQSFVDLQAALEDHPITVSGSSAECTPVQVPPAFSIDITDCDHSYEQDFALLVDLGGNDTYRNNAGGSNLFGGECPLSQNGAAAALLDLGGNDTYGDESAPRSCGANGGGALGSGLLVDNEGDDTYVAGGLGTNGGGNFGSGLLIDVAGDDTYTATTFGANGGAEGGSGSLIDMGGDDEYLAGGRGTNGGAFGGSGLLVDVSGHDRYQAGGQATNGGGSASGAGFLLDADGNDRYQAGSRGTNGGGHSAQGTGFLLDAGGNDTFTAGPYGTNGGGYGAAGVGMLVSLGGDDVFVANERGTNGGAHGYGAAGFLLNGAGSDSYQGGHSGSNGGARQGAAAFLLDASGDDTYFHVAPPNPPHPPFQGSFGTNGGGYLGGVGALLDIAGDDTYEAGRMGVNGGGWRAGIAAGISIDSVGLLFDAMGMDQYTDDDLLSTPHFGECTDCTVIPKGNSFGAQVDAVNPP